ncbi:hypothetical protein FRB96_000976 [Tulasnella sp. 330]|nr:hypothetical protein FRB96_000976 [Tulasnella sp. 330]KAG8887857.1 hypothetical protein FRB98_008823 [Tulasnella sp. 332]
MRVNERTALIGKSVVLVPYRREHVPTYHQWMSDPELLRLTASEPLTFEEELDMQKKWQEDDDSEYVIIEPKEHPIQIRPVYHSLYKNPVELTFIILARSSDEDMAQADVGNAEISRLPMIGDVNLFFKRVGSNEEESISSQPAYNEVECEVMIAEPAYRGKSLGFAALSILLPYATAAPPAGLGVLPTSLVARIGLENAPSIALFSRLGFVKIKVVEVFGELEMRYQGVVVGKDWSDDWHIREYPSSI